MTLNRGVLARIGGAVVALGLLGSSFIIPAKAAQTHSPAVTITVWTAYNGQQAKTFNDLISKFQAKNPSIQVNMVSSANYGALLQKETSAVLSGSTPTIGQAYEEWTQGFVNSGAVQELSSYINGKQGLSKKDIADFFPKVWKDGLLGKKRYMMPFSKSDLVLYFDGPMLRKYGIKSPPSTWTQFAADAKKVTKITNGHLDQWGMSWVVDESAFYAWQYEWGNKVLNSHGNAAFGNSAGVKPIQFFANLTNHKYMQVLSCSCFQDEADFLNGKTAFAMGSIAGLPFYTCCAKSGVGVGVTKLPAGPKGRYTELYGAPFVMFKKASAAEKNAGWLFLKFITGTPQEAEWSETTGYIPIRKSEVKLMKTFLNQHPQERAAYESLPFALLEPYRLGWTKARNDLGSYIAAALTGSKAPAQAMKEAAAQVNSDLKAS